MAQSVREDLIKIIVKSASTKDLSFFKNKKYISATNQIIRTRKLSPTIQDFLYGCDIYSRNIIKHQEVLSNKIISDVIREIATSGKPAIITDFLLRDDFTTIEARRILDKLANEDVYHRNAVKSCCFNDSFSNMYEASNEIELKELLYYSIGKLSSYTAAHKKAINFLGNCIIHKGDYKYIVLDEIVKQAADHNFTTETVVIHLQTIAKLFPLDDDVANYIFDNIDDDNYIKEILKFAIARNNLSEMMLAKVYLLLG